MSHTILDHRTSSSNPLDLVEDILVSNDWMFSRMSEDQIVITFEGRCGIYRMRFEWQEAHGAMHFSCHYDMHLHRNNEELIATVLRQINADLWLGHFDVPFQDPVPVFRHTALFRGQNVETLFHGVEDLVTIALQACEQYFSVFHILSLPEADIDMSALSLALMDVAGES